MKKCKVNVYTPKITCHVRIKQSFDVENQCYQLDKIPAITPAPLDLFSAEPIQYDIPPH